MTRIHNPWGTWNPKQSFKQLHLYRGEYNQYISSWTQELANGNMSICCAAMAKGLRIDGLTKCFNLRRLKTCKSRRLAGNRITKNVFERKKKFDNRCWYLWDIIKQNQSWLLLLLDLLSDEISGHYIIPVKQLETNYWYWPILPCSNISPSLPNSWLIYSLWSFRASYCVHIKII